MTILLLNDTSDYHNGCKTVMNSYTYDHSIKTSEQTTSLNNYSLVVLNGEGTMHDNKPNAIKFLKALREAQALGIETRIYNSVWQNMSNDYDDVLRKCTVLEVREILSQQELLSKHGVLSVIKPDRSILHEVSYEHIPSVKIYEGQYFFNYKPLGVFPRINIFTESWSTIVNKLRHADLLLTNRHHEMYAAIKANCRFICLPSNSHKIEGLFASVGELPITDYKLAHEVLQGKYDYVYDKIQKFCFT